VGASGSVGSRLDVSDGLQILDVTGAAAVRK
jgi:hypothetical protein